MNSTQRKVIEFLQFGAARAHGILGALRFGGAKLDEEGLYAELVAMEGAGLVRVEPLHEKGQLVAMQWALGRRQPVATPADAFADVLRTLGTASPEDEAPRPGVTVHRCL